MKNFVIIKNLIDLNMTLKYKINYNYLYKIKYKNIFLTTTSFFSFISIQRNLFRHRNITSNFVFFSSNATFIF